MGKKHQRDREERREKYASRQQRESSKNKIIAISVGVVIISIIGYAGYEFATLTVGTPGGPENAGALGSAHTHAGILVEIFGDKFDFSLPAYQIKTPWIHFEGQNGDTIHRHATGVELEYLFDSLSIKVTDECYIFPDQSKTFCTDDTYSLKFFINEEQVPSILDHIPQEDDRILISYGSETEKEIEEQIQKAENLILDIQ